MTNGGSQCNVWYWQVGSSATLGSSTSFAGNILALTSISLTTSANVIGRTLARNGAVTLDTNNVSASSCASSTVTPVPSLPQIFVLLIAVSLAGLGYARLRRSQRGLTRSSGLAGRVR